MKMTIDQSEFIQAFERMGRAHQFTHAALIALFDYLEEVAPDAELDVIALCCEFTEHGSALEAAQGCCWAGPDNYAAPKDAEELEWRALEWLRDRTTVLDVAGGSVIIAE